MAVFLSEYSPFFLGGGVSLSYVFWGVHFCFCCLMADFSVFEGLALSMSLASSLFCLCLQCFGVLSQASLCRSLARFVLLQMSLFSWVNKYLHCSIYALVLADVFFLTLFGVVVFDVFPMDVCWAGCSSSCFCTRPFVLRLSLMIDRWLMACEMDGSRCGRNHRI